MTERRLVGPLLALVALAACGGSSGGSAPAPAQGPEEVVTIFMKAAADSDVVKMSQYWGTAKGPAARTNVPPDYVKRITVMQAYLRNTASRIAGTDQSESTADRRKFNVEFVRSGCTVTVPFTVIKVGRGWLVQSVDLSVAGNPAIGCSTAGAP